MDDKTHALLDDHEATKLAHLSLFSGIRGLDLAVEWAEFTIIGQYEWADYPTRALEKHWPDVPRWQDIRTLAGDGFYEKTGIRAVDVISGGFPYQPFSVAGERRSKEDDRYLWPKMPRVISDLRPAWIIDESVAGIVNMALDQMYADLESEDYTIQAFIIPTCAIDAPHRRDRYAITGCRMLEEKHDGKRWRSSSLENPNCVRFGRQGILSQQPRRTRFGRGGKDVANADCNGLEEQGMQGLPEKQGASAANGGWWPAEPDVDRISYGVPSRVDRLKYLGNAVVPQQFYPIFRAITDMERGIMRG